MELATIISQTKTYSIALVTYYQANLAHQAHNARGNLYVRNKDSPGCLNSANGNVQVNLDVEYIKMYKNNNYIYIFSS